MLYYQSENFIIRPFQEKDLKSLVKSINDPEIANFTLGVPYPYTIDDGKKFIKKNINPQSNLRNGYINVAIIVKNQIIGGIGFENINPKQAEIGFWLNNNHRGQGIMTKALNEMLNFAKNELSINKIIAYVLPENLKGQKVLEKNGFQLINKSKCVFKNNQKISTLLYIIELKK